MPKPIAEDAMPAELVNVQESAKRCLAKQISVASEKDVLVRMRTWGAVQQ